MVDPRHGARGPVPSDARDTERAAASVPTGLRLATRKWTECQAGWVKLALACLERSDECGEMARKASRDALDGASAELAREAQRRLYLLRVEQVTLQALATERDRDVE